MHAASTKRLNRFLYYFIKKNRTIDSSCMSSCSTKTIDVHIEPRCCVSSIRCCYLVEMASAYSHTRTRSRRRNENMVEETPYRSGYKLWHYYNVWQRKVAHFERRKGIFFHGLRIITFQNTSTATSCLKFSFKKATHQTLPLPLISVWCMFVCVSAIWRHRRYDAWKIDVFWMDCERRIDERLHGWVVQTSVKATFHLSYATRRNYGVPFLFLAVCC